MNARMNWLVLVVAMALPAAAWAQKDAAPVPHEAPEAVAEGLEWSEDDPFAFGLDDELFADAEAAGDKVTAESVGPDGDKRIVRRNVLRGRAGGMGRGMHMRGGRAGMHMRARWAQLDLTESQRDRIREIRDTQARKAVQRRADTQLARMDLGKLMRADNPNTSAVNAQIDKLARMRAEGMKAGFATRMQSRAVLTPEQRKKLGESHGRMGMRHEMGDWE